MSGDRLDIELKAEKIGHRTESQRRHSIQAYTQLHMHNAYSLYGCHLICLLKLAVI